MTTIAATGEHNGSEPASLVREIRKLAVAFVLGVLAALGLQIWVVVFLGELGPQALYARAIYAPIGFLVLAVHEGLAVVAQIRAGISRRISRPQDAAGGLPTLLLVGAGLFGILALLLVFASGPLLASLGVSAADQPAVRNFLLLMCAANLAAVAPTLLIALLRGAGRGRLASTLGVAHVALAAAAMIALDASTHLGALAVPVGYLIATAVAAAAATVATRRIGVDVPAFRVERATLVDLWKIALPVGASFLLLAVVSSGYLHALRHTGAAEVTGFSLGQILLTFLVVPATALGSAAAVAVTGRPAADRTALNRSGQSILIRTAVPLYLVVAIVVVLTRDRLVSAVTSSPGVQPFAEQFLLWVGPTLVLFGPTLAVLTYLEQIGKASAALLLNVTFFAVVLGIALLLPQPVRSSTLTQLIAVSNVIGFAGVQFSAARLLRRPEREVHVARHPRPTARHRRSGHSRVHGR